ncbi:transposase family protein, partial [Nocardia mangyaensis]|uniref:transposase family protein n=1 Tax=Nocardia mangyaensis TaxID=2213200 RepID=UPI0026745A70
MIAYPAMLDVPRELVDFMSGLLHTERVARGTRRRSRALTCWKQALFVLVWFRKRDDLTVLGAGFGISRATSYRYLTEAITVLAAHAPDLHEALHRAAEAGMAYLILDGKVFSADRSAEKTISVKGEQIDLWYSGKTHEQGGNIQTLSSPTGIPLWV